MRYTKHKPLSLRNNPKFSEQWVQQIIADDPSILGLGELVLRDKERNQPKAGRLDLLLQHSETKRRYETELQLGATDESHIIRTIEYWDIERKRYPQYDHCAVLIAEDITGRFLNIVSLFNGHIPLIAIQMNAIQLGDQVSLIFTKVLDELQLGLVDEDEDAEAAPTDRAFWENTRGTKETVEMADEILSIATELDQNLELKFNKFYIGVARNGSAFNFISFRPKKQHLRLEIKIPQSKETDDYLEEAGFETLDYDTRWSNYRIRLEKGEVNKKREKLFELIKAAYERRSN